MRPIDKINFVYVDPVSVASGYMGSSGLKKALENNELLDYGYSINSGEKLDEGRLQASPILYMRGFLPGRLSYVARGGNQFKAALQSESYYTRHGELDKSTDAAVKYQGNFNMYFVCSESDLNSYDVPTYLLPSWAHTEVMGEYASAEYDGLGFIGGKQGREDFLSQDKRGIIDWRQTESKSGAALEMAIEYATLISKFKMLVCPPGRCFNGMCGRVFEVMACNRLAFQYLNEDTMFHHMTFFKDGEDVVYFHDYDELVDKYEYYRARPDEVKRIAWNGYQKVLKHHNENVRASYIVDCMDKEYQKWLKGQEEIPSAINEVYATL